jgi:hypothetical protein
MKVFDYLLLDSLHVLHFHAKIFEINPESPLIQPHSRKAWHNLRTNLYGGHLEVTNLKNEIFHLCQKIFTQQKLDVITKQTPSSGITGIFVPMYDFLIAATPLT